MSPCESEKGCLSRMKKSRGLNFVPEDKKRMPKAVLVEDMCFSETVCAVES